ncbi:MAG: T9SS type A sorting domain-containing protein [Bacteroidetes bacterium]|nr:MAG: T9SS type A sorting domain-containing protein [Bacteroidota bacterium]
MTRSALINNLILLFLIFVLIVPCSFSQKTITAKTKKGKQVNALVDEKTGKILGIKKFKENISNYGLSKNNLTVVNIEDMTKAIMNNYAPLLGIKGDNIKKINIGSGSHGWYVEFQQLFSNIPIENSRIAFKIEQWGDIPTFVTNIYPNIQCNTTAIITDSQAIGFAKENFGKSILLTGTPKPELVILPIESNQTIAFHLAWKFTLYKTNSVYRYYVSAIDGTILEKIDEWREENPKSRKPSKLKKNITTTLDAIQEKKKGMVKKYKNELKFGNLSPYLDNSEKSGQSKIILSSPTNSCGFTSGIFGQIFGTYWQRLSTETPQYAPFETIDINVYSVYGCPDNFYDPNYFESDVNGCYQIDYVVWEDEYGNEYTGPIPECEWGVSIELKDYLTTVVKRGNPCTSDPPEPLSLINSEEFYYNGSYQDQVMIWNSTDPIVLDGSNVRYHTSNVWNFFNDAPFSYTVNTPVGAWVNEGTCTNGAADGYNIHFGTQSSKRWARSSDVITHEYTHNVIHSIYGSFIGTGCNSNTTEACAMDEGFSDYFAAIKSTFPEQAPDLLTGSSARSVNNLLLYSQYDNGSQKNHKNGQIISGPCWDLGAGQSGTVIGIGHDKASDLVFEALRASLKAKKFFSFVKKMYETDASIYNQVYDANIAQAFNRHGLNSVISYYDVVQGWNMVSLPNDIKIGNYPTFDDVPARLWQIVWPEAEDEGNLWKYDALQGDYESVTFTDYVNNGLGYFANMTDLGSFEGVDRTTKKLHYIGDEILETEVVVYNGWNLIGSISKNLDKAKITVDGSGSPEIVSDFFRLRPNNGYVPIASEPAPTANNLVPGSAYWVKISGLPQGESGTLNLDWNASPVAPPPIVEEDPPANPLAPTPPTLLEPLNNEQNVSTTTEFSWEEEPSATSYRFQLSTSSTFSSLVVYDSTLSVNTKTVSGLNYSTTYYWRVKAANENGESNWSSSRQFTTTAPPPLPSTPTLLSPTNSATNQNTTLYLNWNSSTGAEKYKLQVSTSSSFSSFVVNDTNVFSTSRLVSSLSYSTTYFWRVRASNSAGMSAWSATWQFTTESYTPPDPCQTYSSYSQMDELTITDAAGKSQTLYMRNKNLKLGRGLHRNEEMPPEPLQGLFSARFKSGKFLESVESGRGRKLLPLQIKGATYPLTVSWKVKSNNRTNYWLRTTSSSLGKKKRLLMTGLGEEIIPKPNKKQGDVILIEALASAPPPCDEQSSTETGDNSEPESVSKTEPDQFMLEQNHPNPFNPSTVIRYNLAEESHVTLKIYDVLGREVATLVNQIQGAGKKEVTFQTENLPGGVYLYKIQAGTYTNIKKMLLMK